MYPAHSTPAGGAADLPAGKDPGLIVRQPRPLNAGPQLDLLRRTFVTPTRLFFTRNHGDIPIIDAQRYRLRVGGLVARPLALSLDELRGRFPHVTVTATLQCAGNRRGELLALAPMPGELAWGGEAIGTAVWGGARLRDLLAYAGVAADAAHIAMTGLDDVERHGQRFHFGGSIPLDKAGQPEVILAYEMNGAPLLPVHGAPLRLVVPGYIGARSVKWLAELHAQAAPSDNYFQQHAYKMFPPHIDAGNVEWGQGRMLGETALNAVICAPCDGATLAAGRCLVQGYALAGGGQRVAAVEVSADGGRRWSRAQLSGDERPWCWRLWQAQVELPPGPASLVVRAIDGAGAQQPAEHREVWNFKGYMNNAWHRVQVYGA